LLAIDWDQRHLHLAAVRTQRKGMQVEWVADWDMGEELNPRCAEAVGKRLREFLKAEQVAAGSVVVSIAREKVILKEVHFPPVSSRDEAALVRFQATKDVTDPPDTLEVDYVHRPVTPGIVERQTLAVLMRKDMLSAVRALCRGAGLKLLGVAPRPFGAPYALERTLQAGGVAFAADVVLGVLTVGERWAELCLFRGHELLLARSLPTGPVLVGEVKRSLAVFAAQNAANERLAGPKALYVFGNGNSPAPALAEVLPCSVEVVSPLIISDAVAPREEHLALLAGAVGLAQRWSVAGSLPVNLAVPKKSQVSASPTRQRWLLYGTAAGLLLACSIGGMAYALNTKSRQKQQLTDRQIYLDGQLRIYAQDRADIDALKEWDQGTIPWLDELYDLTARFPYEKGFRINHMSLETVGTAKKGAKDAKDAKELPIVGKVRIVGVNPPDINSDRQVQDLRDAIARDGHLKATIVNIKKGGAVHEFTILVELAKQPPARYDTVLVLPIEAQKAAAFNQARAKQKAAEAAAAAALGQGDDE
jgi:hypothetical protein